MSQLTSGGLPSKVVGLGRSQGYAAETQRLQTFIERHPDDELLDLVCFALGDAHLREYKRLAAPDTPSTPEIAAARSNALAQAGLQFDWLLDNRPQSPLAGRAELSRGWCLWEEGPPRWPDALAAFRGATARLSPAVEQANARFKWADCQARLGDRTGALTNFWLVATNFTDVAVLDSLRAQALFQVVQTSIRAGDGWGSRCLPLLARRDAGGELAQQAELLLATAFSRLDQPESARARMRRFCSATPTRPDSGGASRDAQTEQRGDNGAALSAYAAWLAQHTDQAGIGSNLIAQAVFDHARVASARVRRRGRRLLTNFLARFPGNTNAPWPSTWWRISVRGG
jgi:hypothetical protein